MTQCARQITVLSVLTRIDILETLYWNVIFIGHGVRVHPFDLTFWRHFLCVSHSWTVIFVCYLVCTQENYLPEDTNCDLCRRIVLSFGNVVCTLQNFLPNVTFSDIDVMGQCFFFFFCNWCWRIVLSSGYIVWTLQNFLPEVTFSDFDIIG